jgi:hypothetical protein
MNRTREAVKLKKYSQVREFVTSLNLIFDMLPNDAQTAKSLCKRGACPVMQKLFLIRDLEGKKTFEAPKLREAIEALKGVTEYRESANSVDPESILFECELQTDEKGVMPGSTHLIFACLTSEDDVS